MNPVRIVVTGLLLGAFLFQPKLEWKRVKDVRVHYRYQQREADRSIYVLGEYYEVEPGDIRAVCFPQKSEPASFATEGAAQRFVEACPR